MAKSPDQLTRKLFPNYPDGKQIEEFYAALGRAIAAWQGVEKGLYEVFEASTAPEHARATAAAFHALQQKTKLEATDAAVIAFLAKEHDAVLDIWCRIYKRVDDKMTRRNHFVHFSIYIYYDEPNANDRIKIEPQMLDTRYTLGVIDRTPPVYRLSEVRDITNSFIHLADDLSNFADTIRQLSKPPPKSQ